MTERLRVFFTEDLKRPEFLETMQPHQSVADRVAWFTSILDELAASNSIWVEKTPQHLFFIEDILRYLPEARFIHITRQPLDAIASLYLATRMPPQQNHGWGGSWNLERCVTMWKQSDREIKKWQMARGKPHRHLLVSYEELTKIPEKTLTRCCEFIGIEYDETMLTDYKSEALRLSLGLPWHNGIDRDIQPAKSNYQNVFQSWEIDYINHRLTQ